MMIISLVLKSSFKHRGSRRVHGSEMEWEGHREPVHALEVQNVWEWRLEGTALVGLPC